MVKQTVGAPRLTSTGYASAWALTHFLAKMKKDDFNSYLTEVSKIGPLEGGALVERGVHSAENEKVFAKYFGAKFPQLEDDLIKYLKKLPYTDPIANQTHYVVLITTGTRRSYGVTTSPAAIKELEENARSTYGGAANFQIRPFPNKDAADEFIKQWIRN
jgi:hypothetical protein